MPVYLLTYDLRREATSADYEPLWAELTRLGAHRTLKSVWLLNVTDSAAVVRDHLKAFVDDNDLLLVTRLRKDGFTYLRALAGTRDWLSANPPD